MHMLWVSHVYVQNSFHAWCHRTFPCMAPLEALIHSSEYFIVCSLSAAEHQESIV